MLNEYDLWGLFVVDMSATMDPATRGPMFPHFQYRIDPPMLWYVRYPGGSNTHRGDAILAREDEERERQARLACYISRGWAFEPPPEGEEE